jgi:hypothetical protein
MMFYISSSKFFEENITSNPEISVEVYFINLFSFLELVTYMMPTKVAFEKQSAVDGDILSDLLKAHLFYFFKTQSAKFSEKSSVYFPTHSSCYEDTVDYGVKASASLEDFRE